MQLWTQTGFAAINEISLSNWDEVLPSGETMAAKTFQTKLENGFIALPFDVREEFGRARPPVKVWINGHIYRSTVSVYGGKYFIPVRKSNQTAAGIKPGDDVRARIALDKESRIVDPPQDLTIALTKTHLEGPWEQLSYTAKKEYAEMLLQAKKPETRTRRLQKILDELRAKQK